MKLLPLLFAIALGAYLTRPPADPSLYFHLTAGRWALANAQAPHEDLWTVALESQRWRDPSLAFDVVASSVESAFGWTGLAILALAASVLLVFSLCSLAGRLANDRIVGALIASLAACGVLERAMLSPELISYALFPLTLVVSMAMSRRAPLFFSLLAISAVTANVHVSWFLCLLSLLALRGPFPASAFALGGALSPYLGMQLADGLRASGSELMFALREQSEAATVFDFSFAFLLLIWCLAGVLLFGNRRESAPARELIVAGVCSVAALAVKPLLPYALVLSGVALAVLVRDGEGTSSPMRSGILRLAAFLRRLPLAGSAWLLFCIAFVNARNLLVAPQIDAFLPAREADAILAEPLPDPLWNESAISPYLIYRFADANGSPTRRVGYDRRALPEHPDWFAAERDQRGSVLLRARPRTVLVRTDSALYDALAADVRYRLRPRADESRRPIWAVFTRPIE